MTVTPKGAPRCECGDVVDASDGPIWCMYHDWWLLEKERKEAK